MALVPLNIRDGNGASQNQEMFQGGSAAASGLGNNIPVHSLDSTRTYYRASASFTPQPTGAVTVISIQGSATKTVRIVRLMVGGAATALSDTLFQLQRTSALGAGGTTVNPTIAKNDSASVTATAVVAHYTATLKAAGTGVGGPLATMRLFQDTVTTPTVASREATMLFPERGAAIGQALVLRGTADFIEVQNINAANLATGSVLDYVVEWVEDAS
jgi:hypothetical protein